MSASISAHKHKIAITAASCTAVTGAVVGALTATAPDASAATVPAAHRTVSQTAAMHAAAHEIAAADAPAHPSGKVADVQPPKPKPAPAKPAPRAAAPVAAKPAPVTARAAAPAHAAVTSNAYAGLSAYQIAERIVPSGQFSCFAWIVERESGWSVTATNPSSGAYGLGQALPGSKMASAGSDWQTNPVTQIKWTLGYMDERYGSPCGAQAFWEGHNWY